jgi:hypothetical protein
MAHNEKVGYTQWGEQDMTYRGTVKGGVVILKDANLLPDGTEVTVAPVDDGKIPARKGPKSQRSVRGKMLEFGKSAEAKPCDLPADLAANHDHYLHGLPKRR